MTDELKKQIADFLANLCTSIEKAVDAGEHVAIILRSDMAPESDENDVTTNFRYMGRETTIAIGRPAMMAKNRMDGSGVVYVVGGQVNSLQAASKNGILSD